MTHGQTPRHRPHPPRPSRAARKQRELGADVGCSTVIMCVADFERRARDATTGDDLLRLMFIACHPVLSTRGAGGAHAAPARRPHHDEIARAFLVPEPTIAQRIVRAKRTLAEAHVPFEVPPATSARPAWPRCLAVIYLIFNEGYAATAATTGCARCCARMRCGSGAFWPSWRRKEREVHGLVALMEIQASRLRARVGTDGEPILLLEQNRARWDQLLIGRGLAALATGGEAGRHLRPVCAAGGYRRLPCARAHARRDRLGADRCALRCAGAAYTLTDRGAQSRRGGGHGVWPGGGARRIVDQLMAEPPLAKYHLLPSVRGDLLARARPCDKAHAGIFQPRGRRSWRATRASAHCCWLTPRQ